MLHPDKDYLKKCLLEITQKLDELKLTLNSKTQIIEIHNGIKFLGYRFVLKKNKLYILMNSKVKKRILKKIKNKSQIEISKILKKDYNGYLKLGFNKGFIYNKLNRKI